VVDPSRVRPESYGRTSRKRPGITSPESDGDVAVIGCVSSRRAAPQRDVLGHGVDANNLAAFDNRDVGQVQFDAPT